MGRDFTSNYDTVVREDASGAPDTPFSYFELDPSLDILSSALEANELTIGFGTLGGFGDVLMKLELDVVEVLDSGERVRSNAMKDDFASCLATLMQVD